MDDADEDVNGMEECEEPDALRRKWDREEESAQKESPETITCPHCGQSIRRDSFSCLFCGERVFTDSGPLGKLLTWFSRGWWGIVVLLVMAFLWFIIFTSR